MKVQKNIEVWLVKKRLPRPIDLVQYDTGIQLVFALQDFTIPGGTTATLYVQKPSGKFVYQETGITASENSITIDLENQAITEHGNDIPYQVRLENGNDLITTFAGVFRVEKSLADAGATESKTVVAAFEAKTAEQIAQIEAAAQAEIALIRAEFPELYAMKDQVTMLTNSTANAIKGKMSGAVVFADDVSPVEHEAKVKVWSKNLFNANWFPSNKTQYGVTLTNDGTTMILNGTAERGFSLEVALSKSIPNTTTLKMHPISGSLTNVLWFSVQDTDGNSLETYCNTEGVVRVCTGHISNLKRAWFWIEAGMVLDNFTLKIQLEEGNTATEYTPYVDPSTVTVKRCGKNLFKPKNNTGAGYTATLNPDGSVKVTGSANTTNGIYLTLAVPSENNPLLLMEGQKYTVQSWSDNNIGILMKTKKRGGGDAWTSPTAFNQTGGVEYESIVQVYVESTGHEVGDTTLCGTYKFQLEVGSVASGFEAYHEPTEHIPAADGTVSGITSLSPNMTILTDTEGVIVECEYIRDTKKYVDSAQRPTDEQVQAAVDAYLTENGQIGAVTQEDLNVFKKQVITDVIAALPVYNGEVV